VLKLENFFDDIDDESNFSYRKWNKIEAHIKKGLIETDIAEAKHDLFLQIESFARHVYNVKRQHKELSRPILKENMKKGSIIIQDDFAENNTLKQQN